MKFVHSALLAGLFLTGIGRYAHASGERKENPSPESHPGPVAERKTEADGAFPAPAAVKTDWTAHPDLQQLKAFPGAEGFGALATGGRGGVVVEVTTLEDDADNPPVGSLRWALDQHGDQPKTIVFRVSGIIRLKGTNPRRGGELRRSCQNVTIAGHTAPGDGICIVGDKVNLGGSENLIIRHVRFRAGAMEDHSDGKGSLGIENARNWIIDHCTFGWSGEENMTIYDNHNTTIQWYIIHEGLYDAGHGKGVRGYGAQWRGQNATFHHNLLAHNVSRSPRFNGARSNDQHVLIDYVNNVNYNWGKQNSCYGSDIGLAGGTNRTNFVNNYYKPGPARPGDQNSYFSESTYGGAEGCVAQWYMSGNIMEGIANADKNTDNYLGLNMDKYAEAGVIITEADYKSPVPFPIPEPYRVQAETAEQAYRSVLAGAGAFPRDAVDQRVAEETAGGTARFNGRYDPDGTHRLTGIIDTPADAGGYPVYQSSDAPVDSDHDGIPDYWEELYGLNPNDPSDGPQTTLSGGTYTNLEVYLHDLSKRTVGIGNSRQP